MGTHNHQRETAILVRVTCRTEPAGFAAIAIAIVVLPVVDGFYLQSNRNESFHYLQIYVISRIS